MSKRTLEELAGAQINPLKGGERPQGTENGDEAGDFEDEYEDEFESEDEIFEAGVDGRPDDEGEAEERRGTWITLVALCEIRCQISSHSFLTRSRWDGCGPADIHTRSKSTCSGGVTISRYVYI